MTDTRLQGDALVVYEWWRELTSENAGRIEVARLRSAETPAFAMLSSYGTQLVASLGNHDPERVAILAGILAHVRLNDEQSVASAIGPGTPVRPDSGLVFSVRFQRLMMTEADQLMDPMRRIVRALNGRANVPDLAVSVLEWGDTVRKRWIFDYYGVTVGGTRPYRERLRRSHEKRLRSAVRSECGHRS